MRGLLAFWNRVARTFGKTRQEEELRAEMDSHLTMHIEDNLRAGMTPQEARRQALIKLGGLEQTKEMYRERRGLPLLDTFLQDLRFGARILAKSPGFSAVAILTLAIGIGANTALFSVVNGVLLNPLPYPQSEQLTWIAESKPNFDTGSISFPNFRDWRIQNQTFSQMGIYRDYSFTLTGLGEAEQVNAQLVSSDLLPVLGVKPVLGRMFVMGEDEIGASPVALVSEGFWHRKRGGTFDALGKTLTLDGRSYTITGVVPATFGLKAGGFQASDVYVPIGQWNNPFLNKREAGLGIHGIGRLKEGVTIQQARADMERVTRDLAAAYPDTNKGIGATLMPLKELMVGRVRVLLLVLLAAVGFVLLIACVNVANLLLARSMGRAREFAIRTALGAERARIVRQLLTESMLLALAGGGLGLLFAIWGTNAALRILPAGLPRAGEVGIDARVFLFAAAVSLLCGPLFGLAPALRISRPDVNDTLKEGGRGAVGGKHRPQGVFVVAEMAMALVLLVAAGLMLRSMSALWNVDPGFDARNVLTFSIALGPQMKDANADSIRAALREVERKVKSTPGVKAASLSWGSVPLAEDDEDIFWRTDRPKPASENEMSWTLSYVVQENYLNVMGIPLRRGRFFTAQDSESAPHVAVVDEVFARKYFPDEDPLGKRINLKIKGGDAEIVGVVGHVKQWGLDSDDTQALRAQLYFPFMQLPDEAMLLSANGTGVLARLDGGTQSAAIALRKALQETNSGQVMYGTQTMQEIIAASLASRRVSMIVLGVFAALALGLASIGIYGVISYLVGQRTHEIGVRMAMGATHKDVLRMILSEGAKLAMVGVAIGLAASIGLTRLMAGLLYGVSATDPLTFCAVAALLVAVALAACLIPARRATRVDPMVALRYE